MKNSTQIIGLPIISIADGSEIGKVKSLVINPEKGSVDFLTIEHEDWQVSVKAIPFKKVIGIGEYAVTVENENAVIDLNEIPIANQLVNKKIKIVNTKIMTRKGELLGDVREYFIELETGHILGMQITVGDRHVALPSEAVITFGKDILIVKEDASSSFLNRPEEFIQPELKVEEEVVEEFKLENQFEIQPVIPLKQEVAAALSFESVELSEPIFEVEELTELKEKQVAILKGKMVTKDILDKSGNILFPSGTILSVNDIHRAQSEGPGVIVELSMNIEE